MSTIRNERPVGKLVLSLKVIMMKMIITRRTDTAHKKHVIVLLMCTALALNKRR